MRYSYSLAGSHGMKRRFKISAASVVANQAVIWVDGGTGTVTDPASASDLTDAMGVTTEAGTQSTTQGTGANSADVTVEVIMEPLAVFRNKIVPSGTADTAYAIDDGYLLTVDSATAGGTAVVDATTGGSTADAPNGLVFALDGANAGQSRVIVTHTAGTQLLVTIPWDLGTVVGDNFVFSQYGPGVVSMTMTSDFTQANGAAAGAAGGEAVCVWVGVDTAAEGHSVTNPFLQGDFVFQDHAFNSTA